MVKHIYELRCRFQPGLHPTHLVCAKKGTFVFSSSWNRFEELEIISKTTKWGYCCKPKETFQEVKWEEKVWSQGGDGNLTPT